MKPFAGALLHTIPPSPSAVAHPFLHTAGAGTLPKATLSAWLAQDRLYAHAYIRFIGGLLAKTRLPVPAQAYDSLIAHAHAHESHHVYETTVSLLVDALTNIRDELQFFESIAEEFELDLTPYISSSPFSPSSASSTSNATDPDPAPNNIGPNPITQAYIDLLISASSPGTSLLEGLVVLYATEICYLRAWKHAASVMEESSNAEEDDLDGGALRTRLIPNWTSAEFEHFVSRIVDLVDVHYNHYYEGSASETSVVADCERWWRQVLWLEERFWPHVPCPINCEEMVAFLD